MRINIRKKDEMSILKWMSLLFITGGFLGSYFINTIGGETQGVYIVYVFGAYGYLFTIPFLFVRLAKNTGWILFELPVFSFILAYILIPFIFTFFFFWYILKLFFLLGVSIVGVIPFYFWNVGKLFFKN